MPASLTRFAAPSTLPNSHATDAATTALLQICDQIFFGLLVALVGNLALFSIKKNGIASALVAPLLGAAVLWRLAVHRTFERPMSNLSFHAAADLDRADRVRTADAKWKARFVAARQRRNVCFPVAADLGHAERVRFCCQPLFHTIAAGPTRILSIRAASDLDSCCCQLVIAAAVNAFCARYAHPEPALTVANWCTRNSCVCLVFCFLGLCMYQRATKLVKHVPTATPLAMQYRCVPERRSRARARSSTTG
jgi:hypothetical protein